MATFQCCKAPRRAVYRVDIRPQDKQVRYISSQLNLKQTFESIAVFTHRCPSCQRSTGQECFYTWQGVYIANEPGKSIKSKLQKIRLDIEPFWLSWVANEKISEPTGSGVAFGSLPFFPFTFGQRIVR